jgi:protocatechuate 3,4-dioxygenase beta subunit
MEDRQLFNADPIRLGVTYLETDSGSDLHGDQFQILFEGGAPGTELTRLVINGDKGPPGLSVGDMIFDTVQGGLGADKAFPLQILSSTGIDHVSWQVTDGGTSLVFEFRGFQAGEKLVFSIDVDEVQEYDPGETDVNRINEGIDPIASGVEFQGSSLNATFQAPHYYDASGTAEFRNQYDPLFTGSTLLISQGNADGLPQDDYAGQRDRSAGTMVRVVQQPLPVTIGGRVFLDSNRNLVQESGEPGLQGVALSLWQRVDGQWVFTGHTTTTDAQGNYFFGPERQLLPGVYEVRQTQPEGYLSVGAIPGQVDGSPAGQTVPGNPDVLTEIALPLGDLHATRMDFAETQPISVRGRVMLTDREGRCGDEPGSQATPLAGVRITLLDAAGQLVATTLTDELGQYRFDNLIPGTYTLREETPAGLLDGPDHVGTIRGVPVGQLVANDTIGQVTLRGGDDAVNYDFCEHQPASLSGHVYHDANDNGRRDPGEPPLAGVTLVLRDAAGQLVASTTTDAAGSYQFLNLYAGTYRIEQQQPAGWLDGQDSPGTIGGQTVGTAENPGDAIRDITLFFGDQGVDYDFGELLPAQIRGLVWLDTIRNCQFDSGESVLSGVIIQLLNVAGQVVATTQTAADGTYRFENLVPGVYSVRQQQPGDYFDGCTHAGSLGGDDSQPNLIANVSLASGSEGINYNFSELPPGMIAGYVFRDGPPIITTNGQLPSDISLLRDGRFTPDDVPLPGITLELRYTLTGQPVRGEDLLPGTYPPGPVRTVTNAQGYYEFRGLPSGNYSILQVQQPAGYVDGIDTPGTTGGLAVNPGTEVSPLLIQTFALAGVGLNQDAILQVPLGAGQQSLNNNFSEVEVRTPLIVPPFDLPTQPPPAPPEPLLLIFPAPPPPVPLPPPPPAPTVLFGGGDDYTWHLSIVDAGLPRIAGGSTRLEGLVFRPARWIDKTQWRPEDLQQGRWLVREKDGTERELARFGLSGAIPVIGDFNGDGTSDLGLFLAGEWFLDLNGNRQWDAEDLWAQLGDRRDNPVTGDWNGDGKDDIGVFGPQWPGDPVHLEHEAGLPDSANRRLALLRAKNMPPSPHQATDGQRLLRLTAQGKERADLIDHVFRFGVRGDLPIAGDWNGDGIRSVGVFRDGHWHFDMDGDGRWSEGDEAAVFGQQGDRPVVGDFNGDGIEEIAVFRNGMWIIDSNGNRQTDPEDQVIQFGRPGDVPLAGDLDGDGVDELVLYRPEG